MKAITSKPLPAVFSSAASTSAPALFGYTLPTWEESKQDDNPSSIQLTNVENLLKAIDDTIRDSLTVQNVSPHNFTEIDIARERQRRNFRFRLYDSDSQVLIIAIPTGIHEQLHKGLYNETIGQIRDMGLKTDWKDIASERFQAPRGSGRKEKEGDSTGGPQPQRAGKGAWPTLIIEAGYSESLEELREDMEHWFLISDHMVKIVLLAKFNGTSIFLERWEEELQIPPGATGTQHSLHHLGPVRQQEINITRDSSTDPISYHVTSGALVLRFKLLFLRDPGPGERDIVIDVQELERYAQIVWAQV